MLHIYNHKNLYSIPLLKLLTFLNFIAARVIYIILVTVKALFT